MPGKKVKGTMLIDHVKMVRRNRELDWSPYLTPEDQEIVERRIMPFQWYALDTYERLGWASFQLLAGGDLVRLQEYGRAKGRQLFGEVYSSFLNYQDPARALEAFTKTYGTLFDFNTLSFEAGADKCVVIKHSFPNHDKINMIYCHQLAGMLQSLAEMSGGTGVHVALLTKEWEGSPETAIEVSWA